MISITVSLIFFVHCRNCVAQQGAAQSLSVEGYRMEPTDPNGLPACFNVIVAKMLIDKEDSNTPSQRYGDPSGLSQLESLVTDERIWMDLGDAGTSCVLSNTDVVGDDYSVDFDDASGMAWFENLNTRGRITMINDPGPASGGKLVYDISERIRVKDAAAGDVVVISADEDLTLCKSTRRFDTKVAGVISADPAFILGTEEENMPLALSGIVACNVTAENGPVDKGDLLVSSSLPGYAMRADAQEITPGMVVGNALDALPQGKGKIHILVNQ